MQRVGIISDITSAISDVTGLFKDLKEKFVIGDQVPNYPIRSKKTLNKILTQIQGEFPPPTSVAQAQKDLLRAQEAAAIMYAKGGSVNDTYGMIYDEVVQVLKNYISYGGVTPGTNLPGSGSGGSGNLAGQLCPDGKNYTDEQGRCPAPASMAKFPLIAVLAIGGALLVGMKRKRR